ncbi:hypothetical protein MUN46_005135 [Mesosutterella sp. AGMB02718]|uniref:Uncharacterized protein n=1 Tax=Mesosutterella faecium TaxID=2925194 RepID=A0ABT7IPT7_9BURK|nr:hypothetical protein [Mesosutterella sp. AGMB02718]MDL2059316.1 hypothetical protein [Mesosutterella sp. AGMB02718]
MDRKTKELKTLHLIMGFAFPQSAAGSARRRAREKEKGKARGRERADTPRAIPLF